VYANNNLSTVRNLSLIQNKSVNNLKSQDNKNDKLIEFFNYGCPACYQLQKYMFFWKKNNFYLKTKVVNYYIPINIHASWIFLSKAYFSAFRLNIIKSFHNNIFSNLHNVYRHDFKLENIKQYFTEKKINEIIFYKTINSNTVRNDIRISNLIKEHHFISETPIILLYLNNKIYTVTLSEKDKEYHMLKLIDRLDSHLKITK
jgi:hypothetical protein